MSGSLHGGLEGGRRGPRGRVVEPQRQAERRAARQDEGREIDLGDPIAEFLKNGAQPRRRLGHHDGPAEVDGVDAKGGRGLRVGLDQRVGRHPRPDRSECGGRKGGRVVEHLTAGQWAKAGIEVVEAGRRQLERNRLGAKGVAHPERRGPVRALPETRPEHLPARVPDEIAGAFLDQAGRQ